MNSKPTGPSPLITPGDDGLETSEAELEPRWSDLSSTVAVLVGVAIVVGVAVSAGLPARSALLGIGAIVVTQVIPGALIWRLVRPRDGWLLEDLAAGFGIGSALAVPVQVIAGLSQQRALSAALPLAIVVVLLAFKATRVRIAQARWCRTPWWFGTSVTAVAMVGVQQLNSYMVNNRVTYSEPTTPQVDTYLHQALAGQLLNRGPVAWPTVQGEDLGYHWFAHAWIAQVTASSGVELNEVLVRLMPALMPVAVVLAVAVTGLRLSGHAVVGSVAAFLAMVGGRFNPLGVDDGSLPITPESPTLGLGAPALLLLVTTICLRWRGQTSRVVWMVVPLLSVVAAGTKGSTSPLVVAGLGLAAVAMFIWNRPMVKKVLVDLAVVALGLAFAFVVIFHGSSAGLKLGLTNAAKQTLPANVLGALPGRELVVFALAVTLVGGLSRAATVFLLPFFADSRRDPLTWLLVGASIAGAAAPTIFSHPGRSQGYFYLTAIPLAAVGSALGLQRLSRAIGFRRLTTVILAGVVLGAALRFLPSVLAGPIRPRAYTVAWQMTAIAALVVVAAVVIGALVGKGRGRFLTSMAVLGTTFVAAGTIAFVHQKTSSRPTATPSAGVSLATGTAVSQAQLDVGRYIRDHSEVNELVMTNRHCTVPREPYNGCDSRRWVVTAFSERQLLVEGWTATPRATELAPKGRESMTINYWKPEILDLNDGFTRVPTAEAHRRLWDLGVRWVYLENTIPHADSLAPFAVERFKTADASAWELLQPSS